jgi:hypothetical protein
MGRFLRLAAPVVCRICHKIIRAQRLAWWEMSDFTCYSCYKKTLGEAAEDKDEKALLWEIEGGVK